ncbi:MAG TPA: DEAD/DEAH box helicase family protein [Alphaproteobacteria bacterium]|nr:DEAD/DEAH box helicase family protein [Alphaproteobacteria bacterium]
MIALRPYQQAAVAALYAYFQANDGDPLVAMPTGTGKSLVIAEFVRSAVSTFGDTRVLMLTHVKELIAQNFAQMMALWPQAPIGIYSAGLRRRDLHSQIVQAFRRDGGARGRAGPAPWPRAHGGHDRPGPFQGRQRHLRPRLR